MRSDTKILMAMGLSMLLVIGMGVAMSSLAGCSSAPTPESRQEAADSAYRRAFSPPVDFQDAAHLAEHNEDLAKACKIAGSCDVINVRCEKIDGKPYYFVDVPGAHGDEDMAYTSGSGDTLSQAARSFVESVRSSRAEAAYKATHKEHVVQVEPCDLNCGGK